MMSEIVTNITIFSSRRARKSGRLISFHVFTCTVGKRSASRACAFSALSAGPYISIDVGPAKVVEAATRMGISSPLDAVPSIALGTSEVSLLELTAAYAPFANGGYGVIANVITRIETADGKVLYQAVPSGPGQVIAPEIVGEMNDMLQTALEIGTGKHAQLNGWPIAGIDYRIIEIAGRAGRLELDIAVKQRPLPAARTEAEESATGSASRR